MAMNENLKSVLKKAASGLISTSPTLTTLKNATQGAQASYDRAKTFDRKAASAAGYSEQEINNYLNEPYVQKVGKVKKDFNVGAAMDSGYTYEEVQQYLQANPHRVATNVPLRERLRDHYKGAVQNIGDSAEEARSGFADVVNPDSSISERVSGAIYGGIKTIKTGFNIAMTPLAGLAEVPGIKQGMGAVGEYVDKNIKNPEAMEYAVKQIEKIFGPLPEKSRVQIKGLLADAADYGTFYALEKTTGAVKSTLKAPIKGAISTLSTKAEQALKTAAKVKEAAVPVKQEAAIAKAAQIHREVLRPGKGEIAKIEVRKGDNINDYYKLAAEEKLTYSETPDHKLDTRVAVEQLKPKQQQIHEILNEELAKNPLKRNSLLKLAEQAKQELEKSIKNADEYEAAAAKVDRYIQSEIKRYGENVNDAQLNNIKQGMWSVSYDQMAPNSQFIARKIGFIAKEIIENNNKDANIKQLNAMSGKYATLESLLNQAHGRVVQGGSLGKLMAQQAGATAGAAAGLMLPIPVIGPAIGAAVGHLIGGKVSEFVRSPERATIKAGGIIEKAGATGKSMKDVMTETANQRIIQAGKNMARVPDTPLLNAPNPESGYAQGGTDINVRPMNLPKTAGSVLPVEIQRNPSAYPPKETPPLPRKLESTNLAETLAQRSAKPADKMPLVRYSKKGFENTDNFRGGTWFSTPESKTFNFEKEYSGQVGGAVKTRVNGNVKNPLVIKKASIEDGSLAVINDGYENYLPAKERSLANSLYEKTLDVEGSEFNVQIKEHLSQLEGITQKQIKNIIESSNKLDAAMDLIISEGLKKQGYDALVLENEFKGKVIDKHVFKFSKEAANKGLKKNKANKSKKK